ncbi:armadillo-type protein [Dioszegia hungarica]|uniref:Exportin-T n=1 Tax=Dioszegia hungarica TaxID=4972 RepID=A0AA38HGD8_9TREE|nr:armadillo-type protein [Dioszegia hungarica]KAI9638936.1 armadillo-type protein [Dioszegia hungarica]
MSSHLDNIPQAVQIAASTGPSVDPQLKEQALAYLNKVKELCEETWQDCLSLYLQGAGAEAGGVGKDGKPKLGTELRLYCEQVFETALLKGVLSAESLQSTYQALLNFVNAEWVDGHREGGQKFFRNKLSFDIAHLFIASYPTHIPSFLHPFFTLLQSEQSDSILLSIHILNEIALEIHDSTIKSARPWSKDRQERDGNIRDVIRSSGDEALAVKGLLGIADKALTRGWTEIAELAMKTLGAWTPWVDLAVSLTPDTLAFYRRLLSTPVQISSCNVLKTLVNKGVKDSAAKLQVLKVLDILSIDMTTEDVAFRAALAGLFAAYGTTLVEMWENEDIPDEHRREAEAMVDQCRPLLLRLMSDPHTDIPYAVGPFVSDLLKVYKRLHTVKLPPIRSGKMLPPAGPTTPLQDLPAERRDFLAALLDVSVRQLAWPEDAEWEAPTGEEPDPDDDLAMLQLKRMMCRTYIESIAQIDRVMHQEIVARIVIETLNNVQSATWQQAELALHLVYTFGELAKNNTRAAFFDLPAELATKTGRDRLHRISINRMQDIPIDDLAEPIPGVYYGGKPDKIDYEQYPMTLLGKLLDLCIQSNVAAFPHPSVTLQYFEIAVRYVDFWRSKPKSIQPMLEAMLHGIHHPDELVKRRCFYFFSRFVKDCKSDLEPEAIPIILDSMRDQMIITADLPHVAPDEDPLVKATTGKSYFADQLYLFEAAGSLVYLTKADAAKQISLLEAIAGPLMAMPTGDDNLAVLSVHHHLLALGNFAKGFPQVMDTTELPYQGPFKQMTEALLQALEGMKTQRIVRDSARYAFSQFVNAIGTSVAELVPLFVQKVVTEFEPAELIDFMTFLGLLMHRLKRNTFETMNMLLLPLLSRIFAVLQQPITGTDDASIHRKLKESYLSFFIALMNANLDGVFISETNKPEFENLLNALLILATDSTDFTSQRLAFSFFAKSVVAWGTSAAESVFAETALSEKSKAIATGIASATNQHAIPKSERAAQALPGYENFVYQRLVPACFAVPASPSFNLRSGQPVVFEISMLLRNTVQARGQEAIDFLATDMLPRLNCPADYTNQLIQSIRTEPSKDFRKTFADFCKALRG